jgi:chromosome segregation ATPase
LYINEELEKKDLTLTKLEKRLATSNEDKSKLSTDNQQLTLRIQELNSEIETLANQKKNGLGSANSVAERLRDENSQLKEEIEQYMVIKTSLVEKTEECHLMGQTVAGLKESLEAERQKVISGEKQ